MYRHNVTDIIVCVYVPAISYDIQQRDNRSRLNGRACRDDVEMNVEHVRTMLLSNPGSVSVDNCDRLSRETKYSKKKQKKKKKKGTRDYIQATTSSRTYRCCMYLF